MFGLGLTSTCRIRIPLRSLLRLRCIQRIRQGVILQVGVQIVQEEHIGDLLARDDGTGVVVIVTGIHQDDLLIVRRQELDEAVGVGILEDQQPSAALAGGADGDSWVVAAEKDGVLILILQALLHKQRTALLLGVVVGHVELSVVLLGLVHGDGVRHLMAAALGGQGSLKGVGYSVRFVLLQLVRFDTQRLSCRLEGVISAQAGRCDRTRPRPCAWSRLWTRQ